MSMMRTSSATADPYAEQARDDDLGLLLAYDYPGVPLVVAVDEALPTGKLGSLLPVEQEAVPLVIRGAPGGDGALDLGHDPGSEQLALLVGAESLRRLRDFVQTAVQTAAPARGSQPFKAAFLQWARVDSNHRPTDYESAALTS
jgi:hypothetical protein